MDFTSLEMCFPSIPMFMQPLAMLRSLGSLEKNHKTTIDRKMEDINNNVSLLLTETQLKSIKNVYGAFLRL